MMWATYAVCFIVYDFNLSILFLEKGLWEQINNSAMRFIATDCPKHLKKTDGESNYLYEK